MSTMFAAVSPAVEGIHCAELLQRALHRVLAGCRSAANEGGEERTGPGGAGLFLGVRETGDCGNLGEEGGGGQQWAQEGLVAAAVGGWLGVPITWC